MDDLLREFVIETSEHIDVVDNELVRFERDPANQAIIAQIFRLVHTIKGTCGFLGLPRLEALTHAAENVIDRLRDGQTVTRDTVSLILATVDRIKLIIRALEQNQQEPPGDDGDLIARLAADLGNEAAAPELPARSETVATEFTVGTLTYQVLERPLRPGEASLDELERAFREASGPDEEEFAAATLAHAGLAVEQAGEAAEAQHPSALPSDADLATSSATTHQSVRVPVETLEHQMAMVSELVLTRNQLLEIAKRDQSGVFKASLQRLSHVTAELQDSVMKTRMQPIGSAWSKMPRLVRDLGAELGKDIHLDMRGAETEIDRQLLDAIRDPLLHIVRNAADHGLETAEVRVRAGKSARGRIGLSAAQEGGHILLTVTDDGRGLDIEKLKAKAHRLGLATETDLLRMSDQQIARFIFHPGLSTADKVTSISGRGVGMDVVRTNIEQIGGSIDIRSFANVGTTIEMRIPLTLAIAAALIVEAGGHRFAIPQSSVMELVRASGSSDARIEALHGAPVLRLRERLLPLMSLGEALQIANAGRTDWEKAYIVVVQIGSGRFGLVVDEVHHTEEIVVKPVSAKLRHLALYSGNTILGDGGVIMILDPNGMAQKIGALESGRNDNEAAQSQIEDDRTSLLVFRTDQSGVKAVPLQLVTRLEEIDRAVIERSGERHVVQYRGGLMPLLRLDGGQIAAGEGRQPILVFTTEDGPIGLAVDEIVDIVEESLDIALAGDGAFLMGTAVIRGRSTDIIDMSAVIPRFANQSARSVVHDQMNLLLLERSDFFRAMLAPVLKAAGYRVMTAVDEAGARKLFESRHFDVVVAGIEDERSLWGAQSLIASVGSDARLIGLATRASRSLLAQARDAGFSDIVGRFDREGLLASLKPDDMIGDAA
jgi:two-component system, chemotaxis family, sensor kinase CheA